MDIDNVASTEADDDFDMTAELAAAFDAADETPAADVPAEESETEVAERVRDEKGRFAPKAAAEAEAPEEQPQDPVVAKEPVAPVVEAAQPVTETVRPPPGWSPAAKVAFDQLPPEVKQAVAQREQEVNKGFEKLAAYKPIDRYMEMARSSGTTLDRALENYVGMENRLRQDFPGGVVELCQRQGIHPIALANQILARNGVAPSEAPAGEPQVHQTPQVDHATAQRVAALEAKLAQQESAGVQTEIQRFASDPKHTFFENVKADMGRLINAGYATDLTDAYDKACWANPEIRGLLIKQQSAVTDTSAKAAAATQARAASKSITGSPIPKAGSNGPTTSIEDEIRQLMEASV